MNKTNLFMKAMLFAGLLIPTVFNGQSVSGIWKTKFFAQDETHSLTLQLYQDNPDSSYYTMVTESGTGSTSFEKFSQTGNNISFSLWGEMNFEGILEPNNDIAGTIHFNEKDIQVRFKKIADKPVGMFSADDHEMGFADPYINEDTTQSAPIKKRGINYLPLVVWVLFWLLIGLLLWLKFKSQKKYTGIKEDDVLANEENEHISKLLPLIRLGRRKGEKNRGLLIAGESLFIFRKKNNTSISDLHNNTDRNEILQNKNIRRITEISKDTLDKIIVEKVSRKGWSGILIFTKEKTHRLILPAYELLHLKNTLKAKFADKLLVNAPIRFRSWRLLIAICIVSLLAALAMASNLFTMEVANTNTGEINLVSASGIIGLILVALLLIFFSIPITLAILDHIPAKKEKTVKKKENKDKSHSKPFRSMFFSVLLKLTGATLFFIILLLKLYSFSEEAAANPEMDFLRAIPWFIFYGFIGLILSVSYSLAQRNPNKLKGKEGKKPILYLRSFADDRETTLNERSWKSTFMGVSPPYYFLEQYELGERTWINRFAKRLIRFFYRFHPLFLLRLMFGNPKETSEQQLGNFLRRYGFFVAIGKPGEKIVTTGASRMYVTNEEWQQTVLDTMKESAFVVLQPSRTKGIWWEVEQVFNKEAPEKILLSMVNYHGFQDDYETFRLRMESLFPDRPVWPRSIGNEPEISFIGFNEKWEPQVYYLKNYWALSWPFRGSTANLKKTLKPFIESIQHAK